MIRRLLGGRKMIMMASSIALGLVPRSPNEEEGRLLSKLLMQRAKWFVLEEEEENVVVGGMVGASAAAVGGHLPSSASRPWRWIVVANGFYDYCSFTRRRPLWPHMLFLFFPIASILFLATTTSTTITTKRNWRLSDVKSKDVDNVIFFYASEQTSMPRCALPSSLTSSSS